MGKVIEAFFLAVTLTSRVNQSKVARVTGLQKIFLQLDGDFFSETVSNEAVCGNNIPIMNEADGFNGGYNLTFSKRSV